VLEIVQELQSGRYPPSEWVAKAPSLIVGFFIPDRVKIAPENVDLLIEKFEAAARANFVLSENFAPDRDGIGYLVTTKIGDLYARKGDRVAGVERTLAALERDLDDPSGVRLLRALFYLRTERQEAPEERTARLERARRALRSLSDEGRSLNHRRALATLAALEFEEGQYAAAQPLFDRYASMFPESPWAWVAGLRVGQCQEAQGHVAEAARTYLEAARVHAGMPMAGVLGNAYAARAFEAAGAFDQALAAHTRALGGWDNTYGLTYSTYVRRSVRPEDPFVRAVDEGLVRKDQLQPRIAQLTRSLRVPGGVLLEGGRALLARKQYGEAAQTFDDLLARHPSSSLEEEARGLKHLARVEEALAAADVHQATPSAERAMKILAGLENEPHDFGTTAAKVMRATLLLRGGKGEEAHGVLGNALAEWHERQPLNEPATAVEQDVAQIRRTIFLPQGGDIYAGGRWNAFAWPSSLPPYLVVNADVRVKTHDGESTTVNIRERLPLAGKVLFLDTEQLALLQRMIVTLGGTKRREPRQIMETPNQPVGDAMQILGLWKQFFPARPGHWGGWELETYPVITEIEFRDRERTKAAAKVTIGYSGATVELEKKGGAWIAERLTSQWIT
jgi:tetratricopeptide (TPR) repeat protein